MYQINCGGASTGTYSADEFSSGGNIVGFTNTVSTSAVNNPAPAAAYQSERNGVFSYTLPSLVAGQVYTVRLHFSENFYSYPGQRQFNVTINGLQVLTNFDIVAVAGGPNLAVVQAFPVAANASGQIVINFSAGAAGNAKVSAIELVTGFRVNSGGPGASYWEADQDYNLGQASQNTNTIDTSHAANPAPAVVYQSNRYGGTSIYTFHNLTPGFQYTVRLHFAEVVYSQVGQREFDVYINGTQVLTNYDIIANAGAPNRANIQQFTTTATSSGQIVVYFNVGAVDGPIKEGIELVGGSATSMGAGQYQISGYVTLGGAGPSVGTPITGATLTISGGQSGVTTSASDGSYSFIVSAGGSYTITASWPSSPLYTVSSPISIPGITANQTNASFTASLLTGGTLAPALPNKEYIFMNGAIVAVEHPH